MNASSQIIFSIIIPHKNLPHLLDRCLSSIPERDDIEVIVVDDNSDVSIVDFNHFPGLEKKNVRLILNKESRGAGAARNIGVQAAVGKWLLFADSDDTYTPEFNDFLNKYINCEADIVYFKVNVISGKSKNHKEAMMNRFIDYYLNTQSNLMDIKFGAWEPWNKMVKRDLVIENRIVFDEISSSNDKMFSLYLGKYIKKCKVSNMTVYNYIIREGSIVHSRKRDRFENSFNTIIRQNILYHEVNYPRKVFMPFFLIENFKSLSLRVLKVYYAYLKQYAANPFEGFKWYFLYRIRIKLIDVLSHFKNN